MCGAVPKSRVKKCGYITTYIYSSTTPSPLSSFSCHLTASMQAPLRCLTSLASLCAAQTASFAVNMRTKIIYNWCQKIIIIIIMTFFSVSLKKKKKKKCDCCQKELSTTMPCSVLVAFKGIARRAWGRLLAARGWWAQTSSKVNFAYCTDHRPVQPSHIESAINQLCFMKPSTLIYVCLFFPPRSCKQGPSFELPPSVPVQTANPRPHGATYADRFWTRVQGTGVEDLSVSGHDGSCKSFT